MIYIKRFLWILGWLPVIILGSVLIVISIFTYLPVVSFYYIKNGDIETTPDFFYPIYPGALLERNYKKLEPK